MSLLLLTVALFLFIVLFLPAFTHKIIDAIRYGSFKRRINYAFMSSAIAIDIACNVAYSDMLNAWFIKKGGYHFGKRDETVSSALGKNQVQKTLTYLGEGLASLLGMIQKDHCYISITDKEFLLLHPNAPQSASWKVRTVSLLVFGVLLFASFKLLQFII